MSFPTTVVEIAFNPPTEVPVWTDVTEHLLRFSTNRGRQRELDRFDAGTAEVVLENISRTYDPEYAESPYFGNLKPMRRIRITATWGSVTYPIFQGFIEDWQPSYVQPDENTVTLPCVDGFAVLNQALLESSVWVHEVKKLSPWAWWRLNDAKESSTVADSSGNGRHGEVRGPVRLEEPGLVGFDPASSAAFTEGQGYLDLGSLTAPMSGSVTVVAWVKVAPAATSGTFYFQWGPGVIIWVYVDDDGKVHASNLDADVIGTADIRDDRPHMIVATYTTSGVGLWVDAVSQGTDSPGFSAARFAIYHQVGNIINFTGEQLEGTLDGGAQDVVLLNSTITQGQVDTLYAAGKGGPDSAWGGDTTGERVERILDMIGWPAADRDIDLGNTILQPATLGDPALEYLLKIDRSEFGGLYMTDDGMVRFRERHALITDLDPVATFTDTAPGVYFSQASPDHAVDLIRNVVRMGRENGAVVESFDQDSIDEYFLRTHEDTGLLYANDNQSKDAADWMVLHYKDFLLRFGDVTLEPWADPDIQWPQMLGRRIDDRVVISQVPPAIDADFQPVQTDPVVLECHIEGVSHTVDLGTLWSTTFSLSPADTQVYWILGDPDYGVLGESTILAF